MNLYEKIQKIQAEYGLGTVEFIEKTGLSNGLYYNIKNGKKTKLSPVQASLINKHFPKFSLQWLTEISNEDSNSVESHIEPERQRATNDELFTLDVMRKHDELMKTTKIYQGFINGIISEEILKRINDNQHLKDLLGDK